MCAGERQADEKGKKRRCGVNVFDDVSLLHVLR